MSSPDSSPETEVMPKPDGPIIDRLSATSSSTPSCTPETDTIRNLLISRNKYIQQLGNIKQKAPLYDACITIGLKPAKSATLEQLRLGLVNKWFPAFMTNIQLSKTHCLPNQTPTQSSTSNQDEDPDDEVALVAEFGVEGAYADEILGFDDESEEEESESGSDLETGHIDGEDGFEEPFDDGSLRAFVNESPNAHSTTRAKTQVDLVLPPVEAFCDPGSMLIWPPVLGQKSITWEEVFGLIKQPNLLWNCWRPTKTLDQYSLEEQWTCYSTGEFVFNTAGIQIGIKPPIRLVELYFRASWRKSSAARKAWQRFREIPEWIDQQSLQRDTSPAEVLHELEEMRTAGGRNMGLSALTRIIKDLREDNAKVRLAQPPAANNSSCEVSQEASSLSTRKKRKAAAIDPRRKPKRAK